VHGEKLKERIDPMSLHTHGLALFPLLLALLATHGRASAQRTVSAVRSKSSLVAVPEVSPEEILLTPDAQLTNHLRV
jgi:hypothetical protein